MTPKIGDWVLVSTAVRGPVLPDPVLFVGYSEPTDRCVVAVKGDAMWMATFPRSSMPDRCRYFILAVTKGSAESTSRAKLLASNVASTYQPITEVP